MTTTKDAELSEMPADRHAELIRRLEDGVTALGRLVRDHPERGVWTAAAAGGWTAHDVLVHLRASAEILSPRIMQILVRDVPPLPAFDERRWAEMGGFHAMSPDELFARIAIPRYELIQVLRRLGEEDWARTGFHEQHGEIGLEAIVAHLASHEEEHRAQIRDLLAIPRSSPG